MSKSLYEREHPKRLVQENGICFGRIAYVDVTKRLCKVKTFFGPPGLNDLSLNNVQWVNMDGNADGDESGSIPREGAMGMVFFINGEPLIFGYFKPLKFKDGAVTGKEVVTKLVRGDKIISTKSGNRITIRANGLIELQSRETLKTVYFPTDSRILTLCRNYNFECDGGVEAWEGNRLGQTLYTAEYRQDLARTSIVVEERGNTGGTTIYRTVIGPGLPAIKGVPVPVYEYKIDITGKTSLSIGPGVPTYTSEITPDGSLKIDATTDVAVSSKLGKISVETLTGDIAVKANLGNVSVDALTGNITAKASSGNIDVEALVGKVGIKATAGALELEGSQAKVKLDKGKITIAGPAAELLDLFDQLLDALKDAWTSASTETHVGNLGYNTTPPLNSADYIKAAGLITQIKSLLTTIKG